MTSETLQNPYFVRLFCIWILTKHISNYNIVKNRSFDFMGNKVSKKGEPLWKRGGDPCSPPPLNSPLHRQCTHGLCPVLFSTPKYASLYCFSSYSDHRMGGYLGVARSFLVVLGLPRIMGRQKAVQFQK